MDGHCEGSSSGALRLTFGNPQLIAHLRYRDSRVFANDCKQLATHRAGLVGYAAVYAAILP